MSAKTEILFEDKRDMTHDCVTLTYTPTNEVTETPIENSEFKNCLLMVRLKSFKVTSTTEVVASGRLPDNFHLKLQN